MRIRRLTLRNYRNHEKTEMFFHPSLNIMVGDNGEGKTNIIESIYYLATGRSHRSSKDNDIVNWDSPFFSIYGEIEIRTRCLTFEVLYERNGKKRIKVNNKEIQKLSELIGKFNTVIFSPETINIVRGAPQERRRYLDFAASQASSQYFYYLQHYHHVLTQRNHLLKNLLDKKGSEETLQIWNEQLVTTGTEVIQRRVSLIKKIQALCLPFHQSLTDQEESLGIEYQSSIGSSDKMTGKEDIQEVFKEKLIKNERIDKKRGYTTVGPHRDDILLVANGMDIRNYGSQGQQRTAALSLKLGEKELIESEKGEKPVLLLDDVMSELDNQRRKFLLKILDGSFQSFITTTNLNSLENSQTQDHYTFNVKNGQAQR